MTRIQYQHVSAWAAAQGIYPKRALAMDMVQEGYDHQGVTEELHRYSELMGCRLFDLVPSKIPGYSVLYYKSSIEIPKFTGTAIVCPVRVRRQGCPIVFGDPMVEWGPTRQAGKVWKEVPSVDPAVLHLTMTPEEVLEWAIREQIDPSQAVVVDWVPIDHNAMYVNCRWLAFGLGDDILQVARKPSRVKGYSSMLYRVPSEFRDRPRPCRIYPLGLPPEGCPLIYPKLGMSSTVEDKCQAAASEVVSQPFSILPGVITSEGVYKWAVKEGVDPKRAVVLDELHPRAPRYLAACPLCLFPRFDGYRFIAQAPSEVRDCVRLLWQVDNDLPDDDEGPPRIYPVGMLDGCACVYDKLPIQPPVKEESAEVVIASLLPEESIPVTVIPPSFAVKRDEGCVENLLPTETELCTPHVLNYPVMEALCVNTVHEHSPAESVPPGGVSREVAVGEKPALKDTARAAKDLNEITSTILRLVATTLKMDVSQEMMAELAAEPAVLKAMEDALCLPDIAEPEKHYVWQGTFVSSKRGPMIPFCGRCDMETPDALENPEQECSQCGVQLWMGPFHHADQLPLERETVEGMVSGTRALVYHEIESTPVVSAAATPAPESDLIVPHSEAPPEIKEVSLPIDITPEGDRLSPTVAVMNLLPPKLVIECCNADVLVSLSDGIPLVEIGDKDLLHPKESHMMVAVPIPPDGDVVVAPTCQILPLLSKGESMDRVLQELGVNAETIPQDNSSLDTLEEETLPPEKMSAATGTFGAGEECRAPAKDSVSDEAAIPMKEIVAAYLNAVKTDSYKADPTPHKVLVNDFSSSGDLTVTIYTVLPEPSSAPVIDSEIEWGKFSFGRLGPVVLETPTFRDPPLTEDLIEKELTSLRSDEEDWKTAVSEPVRSVHPKVEVHLTPNEPGESTHVSELYHHTWGKISLFGEKDLVANIPKPKESPGSEKVPGWEEYEEKPLELEEPAPIVTMPSSFKAPPKIGPEEEKNFWVLPGRADPNVFRSVSRVQRVINFKVYRTWGYFMPYAPLWVYEKVAASYKDWFIDEILQKEKMHHSCLTNPDAVKQQQDWDCGKYNPTKYFSLDVYDGDEQYVEKPHPKYYIPYEDTKARFLYMI
ncbi:hypothetical protein XELAEV_18008586mg [Xenopus laevis]|uniref:Uncharacterized protein n=1 Tax=Xenopus laevis TaxID=8355 RepID=A0A974I629_XENLA|nr:hypothetical protein XELAEV_18008586mg [Xenopus laevis]